MEQVDRDDLLTVCVIAVAAACITTTAHEAIGHGGACLAGGGTITRLTSVYFHCEPGNPWIDGAGPAGDLIAAALAFVWRATLPPSRPRLKLLLLLVAAFSLFWEAGYVIYAMVLQKGDWALAATSAFGGLSWPVRIGGVALGLALYRIGSRVTEAGLRTMVGGGGRARRILRWSWLAATVAACAAAAFYTPDRDAIKQAALEIGAASFPMLLIRPAQAETSGPAVTRSLGWIVFAALIYAAFVATLGQGMP